MTSTAPSTRMAAGDRRVLILDAATAVFGERGYAGTTTDQIASAAGVSQPYVVRMFGTKEKLFLEVLTRDLDRMMIAFRDVLATPDPTGTPLTKRLGIAYVDLLSDRGLLLSLMHGFVLGSDPVIGEVARRGFLEMFKFLKTEAGMTPDEASGFIAHGMMLNTLVGMRMTDDYDDPDVQELLGCEFGEKLPLLLEVTAAAS